MSDSKSNGGLGFTSVLQLIFIVLKLTNVITWSWFWVLSPFIFTVILVGILLIILAIIQVVGEVK